MIKINENLLFFITHYLLKFATVKTVLKKERQTPSLNMIIFFTERKIESFSSTLPSLNETMETTPNLTRVNYKYTYVKKLKEKPRSLYAKLHFSFEFFK